VPEVLEHVGDPQLALGRGARRSAIAFDDDPRSSTTDRLARFALAAFDGAFVAAQTDSAVSLEGLLAPLAPALLAARRSLLSPAQILSA
jgi:hypothetical protein